MPFRSCFILLVFWFSKTFQIQNSSHPKKVIRYRLDQTPRTHIGAMEFRKVNMIPIELRVNQLKLHHMFKIINNQAPNYLQISLLREQHNLNTRHRQNAVIVHSVRHTGANSFVCTASTLWNSIPANVHCTNAKYEFRKV